MASLQFGLPADNAQNFRAVSLLLASDPFYGNVPLKRLQHVERALRGGRLLAAMTDRALEGVCAWAPLDADVARRAIAARRLPEPREVVAGGDAILITLVAARASGVVRPLLRELARIQRGRVAVFERHARGERRIAKFGWCDRQGMLGGADV